MVVNCKTVNYFQGVSNLIDDFTFSVKPKIFVHHRVIYATINQKVTLECVSESFPNSGN